MDDFQPHPVRLREITLRGIGPYLHGARLEVRPLTILCGKNGSGKSTWFKALEVLRRSREQLPFGFEMPSFGSGFDLTNAHLRIDPAASDRYDDSYFEVGEAGQPEFGPLGSIGIGFETTKDLVLPGGGLKPFHHRVEQQLLFNGFCPAGTSLKLLLSHPSISPDAPRSLLELVQLEIGEAARIGVIKYPREKRYVLFGSTSCFPALHSESASTVNLGWVWPLEKQKADCQPCSEEDLEMYEWLNPYGELAPATLQHVSQTTLDWIRTFTEMLLGGLFPIGAVRSGEQRDSQSAIIQPRLRRRYVGSQGESTHEALREFATTRMVQPRPPYSGWIEQNLPPDTDKPNLQNLWNPNRAWKALGEEAVWFIDHLRQEMHPNDLRRLNRLLLDNENPDALEWPGQYCFELYVGYWLDRLVGVQYFGDGYRRVNWTNADDPPVGYLVDHWSSAEAFNKTHGWTDGFNALAERRLRASYERQHQEITFGNSYIGDIHSSEPLEHWIGRTLPGPKALSSGFHQLAPIIVQLGLMQRDEVCLIENPEVHLHPSLQLEIGEFFIRHAVAGRTILIETHSDLLIRRIQRAILSEEICQEAVRVYFVKKGGEYRVENIELDGLNADMTFAFAEAELLEIDERGRISNWPEGFMDDDVRESRRLLASMYGDIDDEPSDTDSVEDGE